MNTVPPRHRPPHVDQTNEPVLPSTCLSECCEYCNATGSELGICEEFTDKVSMIEKGNIVATKANSSDVLSLREALKMEIMINQALVDILVAKGILTQQELMAKIEEIRKEMAV